MATYTLFDLQQYIRRVLALNFTQAVWITAEIAQAGLSRGQTYLDLIQQDGTELLAQAQAVLWQRDRMRLRALLGPVLDEVLQEGCQVRLQVRIEYHERYGLKLRVEDADPTYTFGQLALQRRQTVQTLRQAGLLERNRSLPLPLSVQRIAVVSSEGAAGLQDFRSQLAQNPYQYAFQCRLFNAAVQGKNAVGDLTEALRQIAAQAHLFDCAVVLRGGGAKMDLLAFDDLMLGQAVAQMPIPVLTGIGHDIDQTVMDLTAHAALKTPTAVADFLVQRQLWFEQQLLHCAGILHAGGQKRKQQESQALDQAAAALRWGGQAALRQADRQLAIVDADLPRLARKSVQTASQALDQAQALCAALDPQTALQRGFSLTYKGGKIASAADIVAGDQLTTLFKDGQIESMVTDSLEKMPQQPRRKAPKKPQYSDKNTEKE